MKRLGRWACAAALLCVCGLACGQSLNIPAGGAFNLGAGVLDMAGGSIVIGGSFALTTGQVTGLDDFSVLAGGTANLGGGIVTLSGDWSNLGTVNAGTSQVRMRDPGPLSQILGSTTFSTLSLVTNTGKNYAFQVGQTQTVTTLLEINGIGLPIQVRSTAAGQTAFLNLLPAGTQSIANVGVSDVHGTGQLLAPGQTNQGGTGNDTGWFGTGGVPVSLIVVPASNPLSLLALALMALAASFFTLRRGAFPSEDRA